MYATSVGLIMRGFDYLETYKKSFKAGPQGEFVRSRPEVIEREDVEADDQHDNNQQEPRTSLTEKIKMMMQKMFEVEDQSIS